MEEAIEYIWEWNEKYGVGFIKITNQKHIGTELYKGEREYIAKNGIHIRSESYPDAGGDTLFVWGSDTTLNERTIIWRNFKEFDRCVAAINEYNQVHRLKCSICNKVLNDLPIAKPQSDDKQEAVHCRYLIQIDTLKQKLTAAEEMLENLKCCGNCKHYRTNKILPCLELYHWAACCIDWQHDGLTAKNRKAGEE